MINQHIGLKHGTSKVLKITRIQRKINIQYYINDHCYNMLLREDRNYLSICLEAVFIHER
jgi:hypothetical protein